MKVITARSSGIAVPSQYVKNDLVSRLRVSPEKILVTYEAVAGSIKEVVLSKEEKTHVLREYALTQPFLVYTGSVYPHKNVDLLIDAIEKHNSVKEVDLVLAIICSRSIFWQRLQKNINDRGLQNIVKLLGFVDDSGVSKIYSLALALVHPSKMEGFGLTGLEAMGVGLPVISSNATCLPEVYGDAALYFDPNNINDLVEKIEKLIGDSSLREEMSTKGYMQSRKYTWDKMGKETILLYKKHYKK